MFSFTYVCRVADIDENVVYSSSSSSSIVYASHILAFCFCPIHSNYLTHGLLTLFVVSKLFISIYIVLCLMTE